MSELTPKGVVAIFNDSDGATLFTSSDFNEGRYSGCTLKESQKVRAKNKLRLECARHFFYGGHNLSISSHTADCIMRDLSVNCSINYVYVGHENDK